MIDCTEFYKRLIDVWGEDSQIMICLEEMAELSQALCKFVRLNEVEGEYSEEKKQKNLENVKEEIADVINTVMQLREMFGEEEIDKIRQEKIERCTKKLDALKKDKK